MTVTHAVNLMVTTRCDRGCPACNVNAPRLPRWDATEEYLRWTAPLLGRVDYLCITGGEPLVHPDIDRLVPIIAEVFQYGQLVLATNGNRLMEHLAIMPRFQMISATHYMERSYPGSADNGEVLARFKAVCPPSTLFFASDIIHRLAPPPNRKNKCDKLHRTASLIDGRIYPCCVSCGLDGAPFAPLATTWREDIQRLTPPCPLCRSGPD